MNPYTNQTGVIMKIQELIDLLQAYKADYGNVEVMFTDPNEDETWAVELVRFIEVEYDDQYPEEYEMPKGFKFIELTL